MRIGTTLLSLVIVSLMVCNVYAGKQGKGSGSNNSWPKFVDTVGSESGKLTKDKFVEARTKNAPADQKDIMKKRAERQWVRITEGKSELTKGEYDAAVAKERKARKTKGGTGGKGKEKQGG